MHRITSYNVCYTKLLRFFATTQDFLDNSTHNHFKNETILIKGSRNFEFEKVSAFLEQRHHQTCLEINLNALVHNLNYYRGKLNESTKVLAMVKAFSYGSGSFEIANVLQHQKVDYLGVAFADEGVELRKAGISLPIIVMNPEVKSFGTMINYQLEPEIYSFKVLDEFVQELDAEGVNEHSIHVKLDTGMNRLGFDSSDVEVLINTLKNYPQLRVKSVFSHLVGADDKNLDDFTHSQIVLFRITSYNVCYTKLLREMLVDEDNVPMRVLAASMLIEYSDIAGVEDQHLPNVKKRT